MKKRAQGSDGSQLLLEKYLAIFRTPENLNHYSREDYRIAERKFLKYALEHGYAHPRENYSNQ
ncbi:MAG: hypothetical protein GX443_07715 [Deltaproteobacteria bacterium]|nr:hypothetical protein [Deltaproteobacteria bacterium]